MLYITCVSPQHEGYDREVTNLFSKGIVELNQEMDPLDLICTIVITEQKKKRDE